MKKLLLITSLFLGTLTFSNSQTISGGHSGGSFFSQSTDVSDCYPIGNVYRPVHFVRDVTVCTYILGVLVSTETYTEFCDIY